MEKINCDKYLEHLIDAYGNLIFSICYKLSGSYFDAEDLTQDTFLSAYKHFHTFDGKNEKAWICRIATNKCLDFLKRSGRKMIPTEDTYLNEVQYHGQTPEEHVLDTDVKQELYDICCRLKPPYQEIALDYFYYEKDLAEIVKQSGKNPRTIQTQLYRTKIMLRKLWRRE